GSDPSGRGAVSAEAAVVPRSGADASRARRRHRLRGPSLRRSRVRPSGEGPGQEGETVVARKERYLIGLDVGTSKVTAVVGEILDRGLGIVGVGVGGIGGDPGGAGGTPQGAGGVRQK